MPWVSLGSSSRSGGIAPQDPVVNERNEEEVFPQCQPEGINTTSLISSFRFYLTLPKFSSYCLFPFLYSVRENCSTRQQVVRRDEWGQLLLTTPTVSHSLAKHLGVLGVSLGVPLEEEVSIRTPWGDGRGSSEIATSYLPLVGPFVFTLGGPTTPRLYNDRCL